MKTSRLLLVASLLAATAALLSAGPSTQFQNRPAAPTPATAIVAVAGSNQSAPVAAVCTTCACCKKA